jgi:hypothetical protein
MDKHMFAIIESRIEYSTEILRNISIIIIGTVLFTYILFWCGDDMSYLTYIPITIHSMILIFFSHFIRSNRKELTELQAQSIIDKLQNEGN